MALVQPILFSSQPIVNNTVLIYSNKTVKNLIKTVNLTNLLYTKSDYATSITYPIYTYV